MDGDRCCPEPCGGASIFYGLYKPINCLILRQVWHLAPHIEKSGTNSMTDERRPRIPWALSGGNPERRQARRRRRTRAEIEAEKLAKAAAAVHTRRWPTADGQLVAGEEPTPAADVSERRSRRPAAEPSCLLVTLGDARHPSPRSLQAEESA